MYTGTVPNIYVQHSIKEVLDDANKNNESENFWVCADDREIVFQAKRANTLESLDTQFTAKIAPQRHKIDIYEDKSLFCTVRLGKSYCSLKGFERLTCGDIFDNLVIFGTQNGSLHFMDLSENQSTVEEPIQLQGHFSYTSIAQFFPSGKVALSAGMDKQIKIWDLASGNLAQTLVHQKDMVEDVCMIGKGRNLLSFCKSSSTNLVLWEVGNAKVVHEFDIPHAQCVALWSSVPAKSPEPSSYMYDCDDKVALVGCGHSTIVIDFRSPNGGAVKIIDEGCDQLKVVDQNVFRVSGTQLIGSDLRMANQVLFDLQSPSSITQLQSTSHVIYFRNSTGTFSFDSLANKLEAICCENFGVMVGAEGGDLWNLGNELRQIV